MTHASAVDPAEGARRRHFGVPRLPVSHIARPHLVELVSRADSLPLRLVRAGGGFGKTTLLSEWARQRDVSARTLIWVTIDEESSTRFGFWQTVLGLLRASGFGGTKQFGDVEARADVAPILFPSLLGGFESLSEPITLVVDAYERLLDPAVEADLLRLLRHSDNLQLVIGTQNKALGKTIGRKGGVDAKFFDEDVLRFDKEDILALSAALGLTLAPSQLAALQSTSEGWPFIVRGLLQFELENRGSTVWHGSGLDTLRRGLLKELSGLVGFEMLLVTSVLEAFTTEQAIFLGVDPLHFTILDEMADRGLGSWSDEIDPRFRLHQVVRGLLLEHFEEVRHETSDATYQLLSQWYAEHGDSSGAFRAALRGKDWKGATRHLRRAFLSLSISAATGELSLRAVPPATLRSEPLLMLFAGIELYIRGEHAKAVRNFLTVVAICESHRLTRRGRPTMDDLWVHGMLVFAMRLAGRYEFVEPGVNRLRRMLATVDDPEGELHHTEFMMDAQLATTFIYLDRLDDALVALGHEVAMPEGNASSHRNFHIRSLRTYVHAVSGRINETRGSLERFWLDQPRRARDSFFAVPAHLASALVSLEEFEPQTAQAQLAMLEPHRSTMEHWPLALICEVLVQWQLSGSESAAITLAEGRARGRQRPSISPALKARFDVLEAELLLAQGRGSEAKALIESSRGRRLACFAVVRARKLLLTGQFARCVANVTRSFDHADLTTTETIHLQLIAAAAFVRLHETGTAQDYFDAAATDVQRTGVRMPFAQMPRGEFLVLSEGHPALRAQIIKQAEFFHIVGDEVQLTKRERVVLAELASDTTLSEIAATLSVSVHTVRNQVKSLYKKLNVSNRAAAVAVARRRSLF